MKTAFLRVLEAEDKGTALLRAVRALDLAGESQRFDVDPSEFAALPRSPFAYWLSRRLRELFQKLPSFESETRTAKQGLATCDDFRFLRSWYEVAPSQALQKWFPFAKGGIFSPFYAELDLVIAWDRNDTSQTSRELKAFVESTTGTTHWSRRLASAELYFRPGLTWPLRATRFAPQSLPAGSVFSVRGYCAFVPEEELEWTLAVFNSSIFDCLFKTTLGRFGFPEFIVGVLQQMPWHAEPSVALREALSKLSRRAWSLKRAVYASSENSRSFSLVALLQMGGSSFATRAAALSERVQAAESEFATIQATIDERSFDLYAIDDADRRSITNGFGRGGLKSTSIEDADNVEDPEFDDTEGTDSTIDAAILGAELVSWAVGVAFGRLDVCLATGARTLPAEPEPFDSLPACSPGMLTGANGLPLARTPADYPLGFAETGVLVDDVGYGQDLTSAIRTVFEVVFGADADRWWNDIASVLESKSRDLRVWLSSSFFEHHLKRYSKSRRKAPIYWQLATSSARYSLWLYAHRLTRDSFFQIQKDIVGPKLMHEENELARFVREAGQTPTSEQRKAVATQETFVAELRAFRDEIARVAPLWNPNLDDGVVITMAPLWRLVPQHKTWQKELKGYWDELCAGKYNWSHLAMHLWPERVIPNCATDRSIAIAHDLEDVFWYEDTDGKSKPRAQPARSIAELVRERTSPAVKAALASLLSAPTTTAGRTGRGSKRSPRRTEG